MILTAMFDVDGCLLDSSDNPRYEVIEILKGLYGQGHRIGVWSGGGKDYAEMIVGRLGLSEFVHDTFSKIDHKRLLIPDMAFDDEDVQLGRVNVRV